MCFGTRAFSKFRPVLEPSNATVFVLDSIMRFRGTNIALVDKDEPLTKEKVRSLLTSTTPPLTFVKPKPIMQLALEKNRDNSLLALMLHTKHRHTRDPEKQKEFQSAFVNAILHRKYEPLEALLQEPVRSKVLEIVKSELGNNLAKAVHMARSGKMTVQLAAQQNDVSTFDVSYVIAYLNKEST